MSRRNSLKEATCSSERGGSTRPLQPFDTVRLYRFCIGLPDASPSALTFHADRSYLSPPSVRTRAPSWQKGREPRGRSDRLILYKGAAYLASSPRQAPLNPPTAPLPTASTLSSSCSRCFTKNDPSSIPKVDWLDPQKAIGRGKYFYKYKIGMSLDLYSVNFEQLLLSRWLSYSCTRHSFDVTEEVKCSTLTWWFFPRCPSQRPWVYFDLGTIWR